MTNPNENGSPRNDLYNLAEKYRQKGYVEGADSLTAVADALIESEALPREMFLDPEVDSILPSQREEAKKDPIYHHPKFDYDPRDGQIKYGEEKVFLTYTENEILKILISTPSLIVSNRDINFRVWGYSEFDSNSLIRRHIAGIRRKIPFWQEDGNHEVIKAVKKKGFMIYDSSVDIEPIAEEVEVDLPIGKREVLVYKSPYFKFYPDSREVKSGDRIAKFTRLESAIFRMLVESESPVVPFGQILRAFRLRRHQDVAPDQSLVRTHMSHIRSKLRKIGITEDIIISMSDVGYYFADSARIPKEAEK